MTGEIMAYAPLAAGHDHIIENNKMVIVGGAAENVTLAMPCVSYSIDVIICTCGA